MTRIMVMTITGLAALSALAAGCSTGSVANNATQGTRPAANTNAAIANTAAANSVHAQTGDETPAQVKSTLPDAQSFTTQHKDVPQNAIADIEKDTGGKVPGTDHHLYLAFSTGGGTRKQIGAATVVKADGKDLVIVYENKDGSPYIKEVKADGVPAPFLAQFAGKGHDDKFAFGSEIKANGVDEAAAKAITTAVKVDVLTMQALYGKAHTH